MTAKEIRRDLEQIDKTLASLVETLTIAPSRAAELQPRLAELAAMMGNIHNDHFSLTRNPHVIHTIKSIQARLARLQLLLDSAVSFYCGAISAAISHTGVYTANGELRNPRNGGYLQIQA